MSTNLETTPAVSAAGLADVLDATQLRRIEAVHRGFLYQHLYAVGCLLRTSVISADEVIVEHDEDIEIAAGDRLIYVQVKTRGDNLRPSDLRGTLERFAEIRAVHERGARSGTPAFQIVSNTAPNTSLAAELARWPSDVGLVWPGGDCESIGGLPPPWADLDEALRYCIDAAASVPFLSIAPETLVWKLAARVQFAATGEDRDRRAHTFAADELPSLFEQFVQQLQDFPLVPADYRPQTDEPPLETDAQVRLIVAFSGAGKTAWSSHVAQHCAAPTAYFDVGDLPGPAVASALARELAARFLGGRAGGVGAAGIPAGSGLEMLRAIDTHLRSQTPSPIVVVDNAHRVPSPDMRAILDSCRCLRFVFLAQPWPAKAELEALIGIRSETLAGWDVDAIAAEFAARGCRIDPATTHRWRADTGGMPFYVRNAADLTAAYYEGDAARLAEEIEAQVHPATTAQEIILGRVSEGLREEARTALGLLSLATTPLTRGEADALLTLALTAPEPPIGRVRQILRDLTACAAVQIFQDGRVKVHDAMRPIGRGLQAALPPELLVRGQTVLRDLLLQSFQDNRDLSRFGLWLRLLAPTGQVETLVDLATQEFFHESGDPSDLKAVLEAAADAEGQSDEARFWTLDALAFWDWQFDRDSDAFEGRLRRMAHIISEGGLGERERGALGMKLILAAAKAGDADRVENAFRTTVRHCRGSPMLIRILRFNHAAALFHLGRIRDAERESEQLYLEYYRVVGLDPGQVVAANPPEIIAAIPDFEEHLDDLKHLADCLDLYALARAKRGLFSGLARLHAMKFYAISGAYRSAVKAGQEAVDDFIEPMHDPEGARQVMENHLLPLIRTYGLTANEVAVRAQYAVVLAYCGEAQAADREMNRLKPFAGALPERNRGEFEGQVRLVEAINQGRYRLAPRQLSQPRRERIGRNEPCPCGSGIKFKRCHGR